VIAIDYICAVITPCLGFSPLPPSPTPMFIKCIFIACLAFRVDAAGDLNEAIVRSSRSHNFVRSRFARAHPSEFELPNAVERF